MSTIGKLDLENALDKIERVLEKYEVEVPREFDQLRSAVEQAEEAYKSNPGGKEYTEACRRVEDLRRDVTNSIYEKFPDWPEEAQAEIGEYDEEPRLAIDTLNTMEFEIDPNEID